MVKLETAYSNFNEVDSQIEPKKTIILGYQKDIDILKAKGDNERAQITTQKLYLTEVESDIRELERKLSDAKNKKGSIEASILALETNLIEYEQAISLNE